MYVDRSLSEETADRIGNTRVWLTSEYEHNGLRADGERAAVLRLTLNRERVGSGH